MTDDIARLQDAIRHLHGVESVHIKTVPITELFEGKVVWKGEVETFAVIGHQTASRCYAWAYQGDDGKQHYTAVLGLPPVDSEQAAVKAALVAQVKNESKET